MLPGFQPHLDPPFSVSALGPSHLASKRQGPRAQILDLFSVSSHCLGWVIQPLVFNTINVENVTRICTSSSGPGSELNSHITLPSRHPRTNV